MERHRIHWEIKKKEERERTRENTIGQDRL